MKINGRNFTFLQHTKTIYCFNIGLNNNAAYLALNYCLYIIPPLYHHEWQIKLNLKTENTYFESPMEPKGKNTDVTPKIQR